MSSIFLTLRYIAFALFIVFNSVICIVAALNLGSLASDTPRFPEVDSYLIFLGALGLVVVFPVIFVELIRKNAFIARVAVEITWVGLLWIMNLSGAAATTAISSEMICSPSTRQPVINCVSTKVLLAFTWLTSITLLSYLLGLVICAVHHSQEDSQVWRSGVRDYRWFTQRKPMQDPPDTAFSYGKLVDPKESAGPPPTIYAQQMGLARNYSIEPLKIESTIERPVPPVPAASSGSRPIPPSNDYRQVARPTPQPSTSLDSYSLYPQHLQATVGSLPTVPPRASERSPPPAGPWPRTNPQEPLRRKQRPAPGAAPNLSSNMIPTSVSAPSGPEMAERGAQIASLSSAARSRPSGPRTPSSHRPRPPPLDLSRLTSQSPER